MNSSAILYILLLLVVVLISMLLTSARISISISANDNILAYRITGNILKHIKIFEIKSGAKKKASRHWKKYSKKTKFKDNTFYSKLKKILIKPPIGGIHIENLLLKGTYSIGDAAANAILYGFFLAVWQLMLLYLNEYYKLDHQSFALKPDFQNDRNDFMFQVILRSKIYETIRLIIYMMN